MDLERLEYHLKRRTQEPFTPWGQKQNNHWDDLTRFIYTTRSWAELKHKVKEERPSTVDPSQFFAYAANRWFNFWSAKGVEEIFCSLEGVQPAKNDRDRLVDFSIKGITFDHKTSVFPKHFPHPLHTAKHHPQLLIEWLYQNQSQQQRLHFHNRLFIILYDSQYGEHWKLRAEIVWLKTKIEAYIQQFQPQNLKALSFDDNHTPLSDIIWAIK